VIIRVFRPTVRPGKQAEFEAFLRETAIPLVRSQKGMIGQQVGVPMGPDDREFVYISVWQDIDSIRGFAGENWQQAVIDPSEEELLEETAISHYLVIDDG